MPPGVRRGRTRPRASYRRSVCGCMPTRAAATPIMYLGVSAMRITPPALRSRSSRGFGPSRSANLSSASRCAFVSFFGTTILTRASRLPRRFGSPAIGAPRPLTRSSTPSLVPAGTFSAHRLAVGRRHLDRRARGRLDEEHGHVDDHVVAAPREDRRRLDRDLHEEVARRPPCTPASPLPGRRMRCAVLDAGRDVDDVALGLAHAALAPAGLARVLDDRAGAAAAIARLREREEALAVRLDAAAAALGADRRATCRAARRCRCRSGRPEPVDRDRQARAARASANDTVTPSAGRPRSLAGASRCAHRAGPPPRLKRPPSRSERSMPASRKTDGSNCRPGRRRPIADQVVLLALLGVGQRLVGLGDPLEALLGCCRRGCCRDGLARQLAVGLLDVGVARGARHAEGRVVVRHARSRSALPAPRPSPRGRAG